VFHAGDGNLHPLILYRADEPGVIDRVQELGADILRLCIEAGGSITGEHGVGSDKRCYLDWMFAPDDLATMRLVREAFDPAGLANPGKIFPTPRSCGESARRQAPSLTVHLDALPAGGVESPSLEPLDVF
jgi:glycolate oxidase